MPRLKKKSAAPPPPPPPPADIAANDDDLVDDLFAQLDMRDAAAKEEAAKVLEAKTAEQQLVVQVESGGGGDKKKKDSRQRFKEREERKAAERAANFAPVDAAADAQLEREAKDEERDIQKVCDMLGLEMHEINPDGHCLFSAVADQLTYLSVLPHSIANYATTRRAACDYMFTHKDDFLPFLPSIEGEDGDGATESTGLMSPSQFKRYCQIVRDTSTWGGEPEILALCKAYGVCISVVQSGRPAIVPHEPVPGMSEKEGAKVAYISYHRRMYGLGEHYNSLRPKASKLKSIGNAVRVALA